MSYSDAIESNLDSSAPESDSNFALEPARKWLEQVLECMGFTTTVKVVGEDLEINTKSLSDFQRSLLLGQVVVEPTSADSQDVDAGITLDALQYLANTLLNLHQSPDHQRSYTIELDGYRQRRYQQLRQMAQSAVEQVRSTGQDYEFTALSAAERRQVHTLLSDPEFADLETFSHGREPHRRLVVRLAQSDPSHLDPQSSEPA